MAAIFPPSNQGGVPPGPSVCNGYSPEHHVLGEGPLYVAADCTTTLTDCQANSWTSELLAAVDKLGYPYNSGRVDNLGIALRDTVDILNARIAVKVNRAGDTMEGPLNVVCPPVGPGEATCKTYVDETAQAAADACCTHMQSQLDDAEARLTDNINTRVRRDGDQMTGPLILSGDPTLDDGAATKRYVDDMSSRVIVAPEPPVGVPPERLWWDSVSGALFVHVWDGNSLQWVGACGLCQPETGGPAGDFLPLTGGTLTGRLFLNEDPVFPLEPATRQYVDALRTLVDQLTQQVADLTQEVVDLTARVTALE